MFEPTSDFTERLRHLLRQYYEWEATCGDSASLMYGDATKLECYEHCRRRDRVLAFLKHVRSGTLLDVGCGEGYYLKLLSTRGIQCTGLDISEGKLSRARARVAKNDVALYQGDVERLPFPDESFQWVLCSEVLEHLLSPKTALSEIRRVLQRDGQAIISVPTWARAKPTDSRTRFPLREMVESQFGRPFEGHLWTFTVKDVLNMLQVSGLRIVEKDKICVFLRTHLWEWMRAKRASSFLRLFDLALSFAAGLVGKREPFCRYIVCLVEREE